MRIGWGGGGLDAVALYTMSYFVYLHLLLIPSALYKNFFGRPFWSMPILFSFCLIFGVIRRYTDLT